MNSFKHLFALLALILGAVSCTPAADTINSIPPELRSGDFSCDKSTIQTAIELKHAGWTYIMPEPKSPQAAWGNYDGRTTWWVGYWVNGRTGATSSAQPTKNASGEWIGDGNGFRAWRRGGTPPPPSKIEWLCSSYGGIPPR
jgi:hypothetical protein